MAPEVEEKANEEATSSDQAEVTSPTEAEETASSKEDEAEGSITYRDVLLTLAMDQLETGQNVDVIGVLTALGMHDVVETAKIAHDIEADEDDLPDDPDADEILDPESPSDSELE